MKGEKSTRKGPSLWRNSGQKIVDVIHRCEAGSLWISYFGSTKLGDKGTWNLCTDTPSALSLLLTWLTLLSGKPYLSRTHWEIKTRSCLWPVATEEVPCPCCHQWSLLHHNFTSFLGSSFMLPKICDGLVWGYHSKPQIQRSCTPCYILPVSCSKHYACTPSTLVENLSTLHPLLGSRTSISTTVSC